MQICLSNHLCFSPLHFLLSKNQTRRPRRSSAHVWSAPLSGKLPLLEARAKVLQTEPILTNKVTVLKQKMELLGIKCDDSCLPGRYACLLCPKRWQDYGEEPISSYNPGWMGFGFCREFALWRCYRFDCGWAGRAFADSRATEDGVNKIFKVNSSKQFTLEGILGPPSNKLITYFGERMISKETLQRNAVMQLSHDYQDIIAFTYRQNGELVGCKYRAIEKKFWQEKGTERWLYGLDDITEATEIIVVEGEIDKLSMEEAGFRNCVSVPVGAPSSVSAKELPPLEKDTTFSYIWNCKEYLDKISRIILATDGDTSGQALAEELARRLGKERCWLVHWAKKDDFHSFKDANEVLRCLGPVALKEAIEKAEPYQSLTSECNAEASS